MGNQAGCCAADADKLEASGAADVLTLSDEQIMDKKKEPLTKLEIVEVEETWKKALGLGVEKVGVLLFKNIFTMAPEALSLFSFKEEPNVKGWDTPGLKAHGSKVVNTVTTAVNGLRDLPALVPVLQELGLKHVGYGVVAAHYTVVGKALMKTLGAGLGSAFNSTAKIAWAKVFHIVETTMLEGAAKAPKSSEQAKHGVDPDGPLTEAEIKLVKDSWKSAEALGADIVGVILFKNIFELAPDALKLFSFKEEPNLHTSPKFKAHGVKVVNTVGVAVSKLDNLPELVPVLQELGLKHVGYSVLPAHYEVVGKALMMTLRAGLGPSLFRPTVEASWEKVYKILSTTMIGSNNK